MIHASQPRRDEAQEASITMMPGIVPRPPDRQGVRAGQANSDSVWMVLWLGSARVNALLVRPPRAVALRGRRRAPDPGDLQPLDLHPDVPQQQGHQPGGGFHFDGATLSLEE
jgi:hypothetical protein